MNSTFKAYDYLCDIWNTLMFVAQQFRKFISLNLNSVDCA